MSGPTDLKETRCVAPHERDTNRAITIVEIDGCAVVLIDSFERCQELWN